MTKPKSSNRAFCISSRQYKLKFETKEKAERFIKYNAQEMPEDYRPIRAYLCPTCCGWHVTHQEKRSHTVEKKEVVIISSVKNPLEELGKLVKELDDRLFYGKNTTSYNNALYMKYQNIERRIKNDNVKKKYLYKYLLEKGYKPGFTEPGELEEVYYISALKKFKSKLKKGSLEEEDIKNFNKIKNDKKWKNRPEIYWEVLRAIKNI